MINLEIKPYTLNFKSQALTSRGAIPERNVWFIRVMDESGNYGIGEIAPIQRLSPEDPEDLPDLFDELVARLRNIPFPTDEAAVFATIERLIPRTFPSVRFGFEVAFLDYLNGGVRKILDADLSTIRIPINGLVWMGDVGFMKSQIKEKLNLGFNCIKLKVGNLDFDTEYAMIKEVRGVSDDLIIRLDANGAFQTNEVLARLKQLAKLHIHSIEQPILPRQEEAMEIVCKKSEVPIALDEELIGVFGVEAKMRLLQELKPHYLVLKPTLLGGMNGVDEWIDLANMHGIDWWITSYLESNIGLNAIAQYTASKKSDEHHGLGTGGLYHNNIQAPMVVENGYLSYVDGKWQSLSFS